MKALEGFRSVAAKELLHLRRDPTSLVIALLIPLIQLTLFGFAIDFDVRYIPTVVVDLDREAGERQRVLREVDAAARDAQHGVLAGQAQRDVGEIETDLELRNDRAAGHARGQLGGAGGPVEELAEQRLRLHQVEATLRGEIELAELQVRRPETEPSAEIVRVLLERGVEVVERFLPLPLSDRDLAESAVQRSAVR